jgi:hypothetical protein
MEHLARQYRIIREARPIVAAEFIVRNETRVLLRLCLRLWLRLVCRSRLTAWTFNHEPQRVGPVQRIIVSECIRLTGLRNVRVDAQKLVCCRVVVAPY